MITLVALGLRFFGTCNRNLQFLFLPIDEESGSVSKLNCEFLLPVSPNVLDSPPFQDFGGTERFFLQIHVPFSLFIRLGGRHNRCHECQNNR